MFVRTLRHGLPALPVPATPIDPTPIPIPAVHALGFVAFRECL